MNNILSPVKDMFFKDVNDCFNKLEFIKSSFNKLNSEYKMIYKWYFFNQLCLVKDYQKCPIKSYLWEYICDLCEFADVSLCYEQFVLYQDYLANLNKKKTN